MKKAIFLDRDGIINRAEIHERKPYPPLRIGDVFLIDGIKDLIKKWHEKGYLVVVVTNQPDVGNHSVSQNKVDKINNYLKSQVNFDDIFVCYHGQREECNCRKPKIGLFLQAKEKHNIDLEKSYMIGDRWKDIVAGKNAGCTTIFIDYNYNEIKPQNPDYTFKQVKDVEEIWRNND